MRLWGDDHHGLFRCADELMFVHGDNYFPEIDGGLPTSEIREYALSEARRHNLFSVETTFFPHSISDAENRIKECDLDNVDWTIIWLYKTGTTIIFFADEQSAVQAALCLA